MGDPHTITVGLGLLSLSLTTPSALLVAGVIAAALFTTAVVTIATNCKEKKN